MLLLPDHELQRLQLAPLTRYAQVASYERARWGCQGARSLQDAVRIRTAQFVAYTQRPSHHHGTLDTSMQMTTDANTQMATNMVNLRPWDALTDAYLSLAQGRDDVDSPAHGLFTCFSHWQYTALTLCCPHITPAHLLLPASAASRSTNEQDTNTNAHVQDTQEDGNGEGNQGDGAEGGEENKRLLRDKNRQHNRGINNSNQNHHSTINSNNDNDIHISKAQSNSDFRALFTVQDEGADEFEASIAVHYEQRQRATTTAHLLAPYSPLSTSMGTGTHKDKRLLEREWDQVRVSTVHHLVHTLGTHRRLLARQRQQEERRLYRAQVQAAKEARRQAAMEAKALRLREKAEQMAAKQAAKDTAKTAAQVTNLDTNVDTNVDTNATNVVVDGMNAEAASTSHVQEGVLQSGGGVDGGAPEELFTASVVDALQEPPQLPASSEDEIHDHDNNSHLSAKENNSVTGADARSHAPAMDGDQLREGDDGSVHSRNARNNNTNTSSKPSSHNNSVNNIHNLQSHSTYSVLSSNHDEVVNEGDDDGEVGVDDDASSSVQTASHASSHTTLHNTSRTGRRGATVNALPPQRPPRPLNRAFEVRLRHHQDLCLHWLQLQRQAQLQPQLPHPHQLQDHVPSATVVSVSASRYHASDLPLEDGEEAEVRRVVQALVLLETHLRPVLLRSLSLDQRGSDRHSVSEEDAEDVEGKDGTKEDEKEVQWAVEVLKSALSSSSTPLTHPHSLMKTGTNITNKRQSQDERRLHLHSLLHLLVPSLLGSSTPHTLSSSSPTMHLLLHHLVRHTASLSSTATASNRTSTSDVHKKLDLENLELLGIWVQACVFALHHASAGTHGTGVSTHYPLHRHVLRHLEDPADDHSNVYLRDLHLTQALSETARLWSQQGTLATTATQMQLHAVARQHLLNASPRPSPPLPLHQQQQLHSAPT